MFENYLSATIPSAPEGFEFEKPCAAKRTEKELSAFILRVEHLFDLPQGVLLERKKSYGGVSLSDIRAAIVIHLKSSVEVSDTNLAKLVGMKNHSGVIDARQRAKRFIDTKDQAFTEVFSIVSGVAV